MFYRIRNHIFNLNEVTDIHINNGHIITVDMKNKISYNIYSGTVDLNDLMDKIQKDLTLKTRINYNTYISIIRNNEPISFIPFAAGVSDREIEEELEKEFRDLGIPLNLLDDCMRNGMLFYKDTHVYIIDVN